MDADFTRERSRSCWPSSPRLPAGFLPVISGTWITATRTVHECPAPTDLGTLGISLGFGAMSCLAIVALAVIVINRYHRRLIRAATRPRDRRPQSPGVRGDGRRRDRHSEAGRAAAGRGALRPRRLQALQRHPRPQRRGRRPSGGRPVAEGVVRRSDVVGRWGGDEFVLLLPGCEGGTAVRIARDLAAAVRADEPNPAGMPAGISISTGVAELRDTDRLADLVARADDAMYRSRRADRAASQRTARQTPGPH